MAVYKSRSVIGRFSNIAVIRLICKLAEQILKTNLQNVERRSQMGSGFSSVLLADSYD
jgi:hypothetical protein